MGVLMTSNVYQKLQNCRVELQKQKLKKTGLNKYAGFSYFELPDFIPQVNELFYANTLASVFSIKDGQATLKVIDFSANENNEVVFESHIVDVVLKGCTEIQAIGALHTYMKRYLYMNALEITENDLLDAVTNKPNEIAETTKPTKEKSLPKKETKPVTDFTDTQIYIDLTKISNVEDLKKFYLDNKDKVNDLKNFEARCKDIKEKLINETKEGA